MTTLATYLTFDGTCAEAFAFYEKALGGKLEALYSYGGSPMSDQLPPGYETRTMHATLRIEGQPLMGCDAMPGRYHPGGMSGFSLSLAYPTTARVREVFEALSEGGTIGMPLEKTFFAALFGTLTDRFGTPWMVICEKEA